jgi:hypothetical protein
MTEPLGRLERVDLREIWEKEDTHFTPWLAREENISVLGDALGKNLVLEAKEQPVGRFRADILCKEDPDGTLVLIENQLEDTDHKHLGQLLTYASGLQAVTVVWIAARFNEEHRSTLDWLNKITDDSFQFFGLEVELWRIGTSPAAPKFNIVSKPNDWSRSVARAVRAIDDQELTDNRILQREYWEALHACLEKAKGPVSGNRKAQPQSWMTYSIGRTGFNLGSTMLRREGQIRAELYIAGDQALGYFRLLEEQKEEIQGELGFDLTWEELQNRRDCRIAVYLGNLDPEDRNDWPRQHEWLSNRMNKMHKAFANRVRELNINEYNEID